MDYYQVLQVGKKAPPEEIKKAYRSLSRKYHPDNAGEENRDRFERVQKAYAVLSDEKKREEYDRLLQERAAGAGAAPFGKNTKKAAEKKAPDFESMDPSAFFGDAAKANFGKFFGFGEAGENKKSAKPVDTDPLFESFFHFKS